jgi:hypothetical protein
MATVKFFVPQWTGATDPHSFRVSALCDYVHVTRMCGMQATDIGEQIFSRWPDVIPGGRRAATRLVEICAFADAAHSGGLIDADISTEIEAGWPDVIPGGAEVATSTDGTIWVVSGDLIPGDLSPGRQQWFNSSCRNGRNPKRPGTPVH